MTKIICWEEIIAEGVTRIDLFCSHCKHINILVKGENLNCERCGEQLLKFVEVVEEEQ